MDHEKSHLNIFSCDLCKKEFRSKEKYENHLIKNHESEEKSDRPYICDFCGGSFKKFVHLKSHISYRHMSTRPFSCPECHLKFKFQCDVNSHRR